MSAAILHEVQFNTDTRHGFDDILDSTTRPARLFNQFRDIGSLKALHKQS
ncbi:Uncharacterised protein [Vibrio cholerae]|nr:Uncharacterised protein [Vibrio cholerae]